MKSVFLDHLRQRVLVIDGAMGTSVHAIDLPESDYRGCENCPEILNESRPDAVEHIHASFLRVGCDAVETNTFGGNKIVLAEFGIAERTYAINKAAAQAARRACEKFSTREQPRFVLGSMGPGTKLPTLGHTTFDVLEDSYHEQARGLLDGGCDAFIIETCQDLLQCKTAICGATRAMHEASRPVPIIAQVTMETTGTMLVGSEIGAAMATLEAYPQIQVIGLNCATGPQEMSEHIRFLSRHCTRMLSVVPNAGLPQLVEGRTHYALTPAELARWLKEFVDVDGVNLVGGCCGTTPEHLAAVVEAIGRRAPKPRSPKTEAMVASIYQAVPIRQDNSFLIVGERTNANGSKKFRELLERQDVDGMVQMAREQVAQGSHVLDVCAAYVGRDETADMERCITRFRTEVTVPLMIDSTEYPVIDNALKMLGGKCIINSINLEDGEERMQHVCPLAVKYGAALVALTIDERGMAKTADEKVAVAKRIHDLATTKYGIAAGDLLFDPLTFTIGTGNEDDRRLGLETLEAIRRIKQEIPAVHTLLGLSNISFGLKPAARHVLNSVFLHHAREAGLDAAIVHAAGIEPLFKIDPRQRDVAEDLIFDRRRPPSENEPDGYDPLKVFLSLFPDTGAAKQEKAKKPAGSVEERLKNRIVDGDKQGLEDDLDEAMQRWPALSIINNVLLDGMKVVGDLFGAGQMQLPFVLASAETMKAAVRHLEPHMERVDGSSKGRIVLATVKGDVHDIGKNLVDIILRNNGYTVFNLGIKQPIGQILEAFDREKADAIGLSGLLVKSTLVMRDDLHILNERKITAPVILGGAALTRKYVEQDLRAIYKGPLFYAKDAFEGLGMMDRIMSGDLSYAPTRFAAQAEVRAECAVARGPEANTTVRRDVPIPPPPFWGPRVVEQVPLQSVLGYMNDVMLFQVQWQYKRKGRPEEEFQTFIKNEVRPIYHELAAQCGREKILQPRAIYGYWPCNSEGNDLIIYEPPVRGRHEGTEAPRHGGNGDGVVCAPSELKPGQMTELARFTFPRQENEPYLCLSDFWRPVASGEVDVAAFHIVTVGQQASDISRQWFEQDRYRDYLHLHGLSVEAAEALAEYMHKQIRMELGIAGDDARDKRKLFQQGYQGSRYSFGYPACPNLDDQVKLWPLLQPDRIGVTLSEEFQLHPEQSTSAIIAHHPQARYFNVRKLTDGGG